MTDEHQQDSDGPENWDEPDQGEGQWGHTYTVSFLGGRHLASPDVGTPGA